jgi:hypothetical protein
MEDGWTFVAPKTKANKKNAPPKSKKTPIAKEEEPPIILNSTFDKKESDDSDILNHKQEVYNVYTKPEENLWQTVPSKSKRQKRKPKEKEEKPKETKKPKPKKMVEQKSEEQILKEKDERRARKEWKRGDKLLYFYAFLKQDVTATITNTTADSLIIQWEGIQQSVGRNDKSIKPIWNAKNKCYFPLPKKQKKKKAVKEQPKPKQEKKKKPKKKGPKKVEIKKIEPKIDENNVIKLETPKEELEIFDEIEEDKPLVLTNEIKVDRKNENIKRINKLQKLKNRY